jgi:hypothetical protein
MANLDAPLSQTQTTDKRASQALSIQLPTQAMIRIGPPGNHTLCAVAKMFGSPATTKGSLVIENSFPSPFGINEPEGSKAGGAVCTLESDPEKSLRVEGAVEGKLAPCDGGRRAWACLLGAAMIEGLLWGTYHLSIP